MAIIGDVRPDTANDEVTVINNMSAETQHQPKTDVHTRSAALHLLGTQTHSYYGKDECRGAHGYTLLIFYLESLDVGHSLYSSDGIYTVAVRAR